MTVLSLVTRSSVNVSHHYCGSRKPAVHFAAGFAKPCTDGRVAECFPAAVLQRFLKRCVVLFSSVPRTIAISTVVLIALTSLANAICANTFVMPWRLSAPRCVFIGLGGLCALFDVCICDYFMGQPIDPEQMHVAIYA